MSYHLDDGTIQEKRKKEEVEGDEEKGKKEKDEGVKKIRVIRKE